MFDSHGIKDLVTKVSIGNFHDNHSDHLPVEIDLSLRISNMNGRANESTNTYKNIMWSKLSSNDLDNYSSTMETALDLIDIPPSILHGHFLCQDDSHKYDLELYFAQIIECISLADSVLERKCFHALKPYWSTELSLLKRQSYINHKAWLDNDKPSVGPIYNDYLASRSNYR